MGTTLVKRVNIAGATIPDITSVDFDNPLGENLVICQETMDEEAEAIDGTPAQVPLYSRLTGLRLQAIVSGASAATHLRWSLAKSPDGDLTAANFNTNWHTSNDDATAREVRKYMIAKGLMFINPSTLGQKINIFVRRQALKRIQSFREGDVLKFTISKDAPGTTCLLSMWGNIYFKANG